MAFAAFSGPNRRAANSFSHCLRRRGYLRRLARRRVEPGGVHDVGVDRTGADRRQTDSRGIEFGPQAVGEHVHRGLAGAVRVERLQRGERRGGRDVDDVPTGAALDEPARECPAAVDHAAQVDVEDPVPLLRRGVDEPARVADACVVHHDVWHSVFIAHLVGERLDSIGVGHVQCVRVRDAALRRNAFRGLPHADLIDIAGHHFGALTREFDRGGPAYSAARAGDRHQHIAERFPRLAHLRAPHRPAGRPALGDVDHFGDRGGQHLRM